MRSTLLVLALAVAGCADPLGSPKQPPVADPAPPVKPVDPAKLAERLPDAPKLDAANKLTPLTPDKSLLLESAPDPAKPGKFKPVRLLVQCEVCPPAPMLEVLLCKTNTKEHEAIIRTAVDARLIHGGLVALGLKPGGPATFVNRKTGEPDYKPATGSKVAVDVHYRKGGKLHTHAAQEWVRDVKAKKPMEYGWVFAGSRFIPYEDEPDKPPYYAANGGDVIGVSNFFDSMLDIPVKVTDDNENLAFEADYARVPPPLSKVWLVLSAAPPEAKKRAK